MMVVNGGIFLLFSIINFSEYFNFANSEFFHAFGTISNSTRCSSQNFSGDGTFTYSRGTVGTCEYIFKSLGNVLRIRWKSFVVPGEMPFCSDRDYVKTYIGCSNSIYLTSFCSSNMVAMPHDLYGRDGCIKLVVTSTGSSDFWFTVHGMPYRVTDFPGHCYSTSTFFKDSGVIASPKWPDEYQPNDFLGEGKCKWVICAASTKEIELNFMDVDIMDPNARPQKSHLVIKEKRLNQTNYTGEKQYCEEDPFSLRSKYYRVEIEMKAPHFNHSKKKRGFILGYVTYNINLGTETTVIRTNVTTVVASKVTQSPFKGKTSSKSRTKWIVIGAVLPSLLILGLVICFLVLKSRNNKASTTVDAKQTSCEASNLIASNQPTQHDLEGSNHQSNEAYPLQQTQSFTSDSSMS